MALAYIPFLNFFYSTCLYPLLINLLSSLLRIYCSLLFPTQHVIETKILIIKTL